MASLSISEVRINDRENLSPLLPLVISRANHRGFSETRTRWRVLECPSRAHAHTPRGNYYDQHPPHFGTVERVTSPGFRFNLHLFHVGMGRLTARDKPNPQVGWDGTTGKYCLAETQARGVVGPLAEPKAYEKSNPRQKPTKLRKRDQASGQAGKAGSFDRNGEADFFCSSWREE